MPFARRRLDILVVPDELERPPDRRAFEALQARWAAEGRLEASDGLVRGGVGGVRLDLPSSVTLYANQLGGFKVRCPVCQASLARDFSKAVQRWRTGSGGFAVDCPGCGVTCALDAVDVRPPVAFGRGAVVFVDVGSDTLADGVLDELEEVVGPRPRVVLRRPV